MTSRTITTTQKITCEQTGLRASLFVHVDSLPDGRVVGVRFAEKGKDGGTLDNVLAALGDAVTSIMEEIANPPKPEKDPRLCITEDCRNPKQPGRTMCAGYIVRPREATEGMLDAVPLVILGNGMSHNEAVKTIDAHLTEAWE